MHPSSLLSYYPTYAILDEIASYGNYKKLTIFIDLKNTLQTTYMEHAIVNILQNSKTMKFIDTSIFSSLVSFLGFHKIYGYKRGLEINFIIFFESGQSYYHQNISKRYKISRKIDDLYGLEREDRELFWKILANNFKLIDQVFNKIPKVKVINMSHFEADFIPYYILSRKKVIYDGSVGYIVYSNDHDLMQCAAKDSYIFSKSAKSKKIIKPGNIMNMYLKRNCDIEDIYLPLAMAIIGDTGDDVFGVKGIGPAKFIEIFSQLISMTGNIWEIYNNVENNRNIFSSIPLSISNKHLKKVIDSELENQTISKNLKLVSFELISRAIDNPNTTEMIEKRKYVEKILKDNIIYPLDSMKNALTKTGVYLEESSLDYLYLL